MKTRGVNLLAQAALSLYYLGSFIAVSASTVSRATVCNGDASLCNRSYGNVTFTGAHDSYADSSTNIAANQDYDVTKQLDDGIRLLQIQCLSSSGSIRLCHTSCLLFDGGLMSDYLTKVLTWVKAHPTEVVTILAVNINDLQASAFAAVYEAVGLDKVSYSPPKPVMASTDWPTLGDMIDAGTTVVTFLDHMADPTQATYIIDEFSNMWETAFDVTDPAFDCNVNRTQPPGQKLYLINHFLDEEITILGGVMTSAPAKDALLTTNALDGPGSIGAQVDTCIGMWGRPPNFVLVDFYDYGNGSTIEVSADLNGVPFSPASPIAPPPSVNAQTSPSKKKGDAHLARELTLVGITISVTFGVAGAFLLNLA